MPVPKKKPIVERPARGLYHDVGLRLMKLLNILLIVLPFACCWFMYYAQRVIFAPSALKSAGILMLFVLLYGFFGRVYDGFLISLKRISDLFFSQLLGILMADAFMFITLWLMSGGFPNLLPALAALAGQTLCSFLWCKYAHKWYFDHFAGQKTYVIYEQECGMEDLFSQYGLGKRFDVQGACTAQECLKNAMRDLQDCEAVFLCGIHSHERNQIMKYCVANGVSAYVIPRIGDIILNGSKRMHMFHLPVLRVERYNPSPEYLLFKRIFDILSSAAAILITSPLMLGIAIAIKAQDGGPVFYRQVRLTRDGREFRIVNVRCMEGAGYSARNSHTIAA